MSGNRLRSGEAMTLVGLASPPWRVAQTWSDLGAALARQALYLQSTWLAPPAAVPALTTATDAWRSAGVAVLDLWTTALDTYGALLEVSRWPPPAVPPASRADPGRRSLSPAPTVLLIGAPGAGKGTQARMLQERHGFRHLASGDLLRAAVAAGTARGKLAQRYMDRGELVPDDLVIGLILEQLADPQCGGIILDGFPRTHDQARALEPALASIGRRVDAVLFIEVPVDVLIERLVQREQCADCGAIYSRAVRPPRQPGRCDQCDGVLYQRHDDHERAVARRLEAYFSQTLPLIRHYEATGCLVRISGDQAVARVTRHVLNALGLTAATSRRPPGRDRGR